MYTIIITVIAVAAIMALIFYPIVKAKVTALETDMKNEIAAIHTKIDSIKTTTDSVIASVKSDVSTIVTKINTPTTNP